VTGRSLYIIIEEAGNKVHILHPWTLEERYISRAAYLNGMGPTYWPENNSGDFFSVQKVADRLHLLIQDFALRKKAYPARTVMRALADLTGKTFEQVDEIVQAALPAQAKSNAQVTKTGRQFRLAPSTDIKDFRGRPRVILDVIAELKQSSIPVIVEKVQGRMTSKLDHDRVVTYFVNKFVKEGILEEVGKQLTL
jgi:hypothetical protein